MNLKKTGKVLTSKSVETGPLSYKKKYLPGRGLTKVEKHWTRGPGSIFGRLRVSHFATAFRLALGPTQTTCKFFFFVSRIKLAEA